MYGLILVCLCSAIVVSTQNSQRIDPDPQPRYIDDITLQRDEYLPLPPVDRVREPPLQDEIVSRPPQRRRFPPFTRGNGNARRICAQFGEEPTYESSGAVQRCVWTIPPCRGREVVCRTDGSSYVCCQRPFCRDGTRAQGFCMSDRECPIGYNCQNYERNRDGICCQRHISRFQYV